MEGRSLPLERGGDVEMVDEIGELFVSSMGWVG